MHRVAGESPMKKKMKESIEEDDNKMASSEEDPRSKRGGHRLFDHSSFPDAVILRVRGRNFMISASYLALHSSFFYNLFYGLESTGQTGKIELDVDPDVFGDLLDMIYPCYKKTDCCVDCSSSFVSRLDVALKLKLRLAVKRLLENASLHQDVYETLEKHRAWHRYEHQIGGRHAINVGHDTSPPFHHFPVSTRFPDSTTVIVRGMSMVISATTLSLHSPVLAEKLYKNGQLVVGVKIDVDPHSFITFLQATTGDFPSYSDCTRKLLDDLLTLGAKQLYEYILPEIRWMMTRPTEGGAHCAMQLLEHFANQSTVDMESLKHVAHCLSKEDLEKVLSKCPSLSASVRAELRIKGPVTPIQIYVKTLTGKTLSLKCPEGIYTAVCELKYMIQNSEGIPPDQQRLIYSGDLMSDKKILEYYRIKDGSILHLVLNLSGC